MSGRIRTWILAALLSVVWQATVIAASPGELLDTIKAVGREGEGHVAASRALQELTRANAAVLPEVLRAFDGAGPLAANWLRSGFESIADRALKQDRPLPTAELEAVIRDRERDPRARRLAYEWLAKVDPPAAERLVPGMLDDPSPELRREAVQRLIDEADALHKRKDRQAAEVYRQALTGATDDDQVKAIVKPLRELGDEIDLQKHFGFLTEWRMIGPFDHRGLTGFDVAYPPEKEIKLDATYEGQLGEVRWTPVTTEHEYGVFDIAKQISPYKGAVMYATTAFQSDEERPVEFRLGTPNGWKLWLNGELLFAREEYHRGMALDQYRVPAVLRPGRNVILLKICQNEQDQDWAQRYQFQLRVCDPSGTALLPRTTAP